MSAALTIDRLGGLADAEVFATEFAPAKINLFLHIVGRREDGRHELESIFAFADVGDKLRFERNDEFSLTLTGPFSGALGRLGGDGNDNLVLKAAKLLAAQVGQAAFPVAIELEKNLPVASGVGGGSADAASTLRALTSLWAPQLPASQLHDLALQLGADVPACLVGATARVTGIGEVIESSPASTDRFYAVLVNPRAPLSTAAVFNRYREASENFSDRLVNWPDAGDGNIFDALAGCCNDLSRSAVSELPVIADVLAALENLEGCRLARMSGSGATCFALFDSRDAAEVAALGLQASRPDWWVTATTLGSTQSTGGPE